MTLSCLAGAAALAGLATIALARFHRRHAVASPRDRCGLGASAPPPPPGQRTLRRWDSAESDRGAGASQALNTERDELWKQAQALRRKIAQVAQWPPSKPGGDGAERVRNPRWEPMLTTEGVSCVVCHLREDAIVGPHLAWLGKAFD